MKKSAIAIAVLSIALIGTNTWWAFKMLDAGISYTYQGVSLEDNQQALHQALAIIKVSAAAGASREQIVSAARGTRSNDEIFEKDGYLWVGRLGLRFNEAGQLLEAIPGYQP